MTRVILVACLLLFSPFSYAEDSSVSDPNLAEVKGGETSAPPEAELKFGGKYSAGVFFGHIITIDSDQRFVFVRPTNRSYARKHFYLDSKTLYTFMEEGKSRKKRLKDLVEGQKVAVRYFSRKNTAIADEVFVVIGEFKPEVYEKRRGARKSVKKKSSKEKSSKADSSDSGEAGTSETAGE